MHIHTADHSPATIDSTDHLLRPLTVGALDLSNRTVMAPMTRMRADADFSPLPMMAEYYAQRATAGLIITEATAAIPYGAGLGPMPALHAEHHEQGWRNIVEAVHANGGLIAAQLWNVGRARTEDEGKGRPPGWTMIDELRPETLTSDEVRAIPNDFGAAAARARDLGFDAVEVHAGSSNLLDRFLRPSTNQRTDSHGGSADGRVRVLLEVVEAVSAAIGSDRTGLKIGLSAPVDGRPDPLAREAFAYLLGRLAHTDLAYLHVNRVTDDDRRMGANDDITLQWIREHYAGTLFAAGGFSREDGEEAIATGLLDAVVYGRSFLANPDLPARFAARAPLNEGRRPTFYTNGEEGLIDYPFL